ncbi:MAG: tail fiber domain-containing protein, partial [Limnobacter sp.]|nr:tail fiber domain-containing protein [Limnobacter sp.]
KRLKTNIALKPSSDLLNQLSKINVYSYLYKANPELGARIGVLAQDVLPVFPEVVALNNAGLYSVDYNALGAIAAAGVGELNRQIKPLQSWKLEAEKTLLAHGTQLTSLEEWRVGVEPRLDALQLAVSENIRELALQAATLATHANQITRLDDALTTERVRIDAVKDDLEALDQKWSSLLTLDPSAQSLRVNVNELKVSNLTASLMRSDAVYTAMLEAEMARLGLLNVDEVTAERVNAGLVTTGTASVYVSTGATVTLFHAVADGHYSLTTSAPDGSFATASLVVSGGVVKVVPGVSEGIEVTSFGNAVQVQANGKQVKASWLKTG